MKRWTTKCFQPRVNNLMGESTCTALPRWIAMAHRRFTTIAHRLGDSVFRNRYARNADWIDVAAADWQSVSARNGARV